MSTLLESVRGAEVQRAGSGGRFYVWKRERYWGVTTIINGGIPKPVLVNWAKKFTAEYAIANLDVLAAMVKKAKTKADEQGAVDWLKNAAFRDRDAKANLGSIIHDIAEAHVIGRPYPTPTEEQAPYVATFLGFLADFSPRFVAVEMPVFNRRYLYAGTLDAIVDIGVEWLPGGEDVWGAPPDDRDFWRLVVDYKTGASGPWPEVGLQNTAYRRAEFVGQPNDREAPMPSTDGAAVLKIRPDGYEFYPVRSDQVVFDAFLYAREVYRWAQETSKDVIGDQIVSAFALQRALEQSLEAVGEANGGENPALGSASENSVSPDGDAEEGAGGQAKVASSPEVLAEEPAPAPSPKPRAKKEAR